MTRTRLILHTALALCLLPGELPAQQAVTPPTLGVATNFGQGWKPDMMQAARDMPVTDFRDAVYWSDIEQSDGSYVYDRMEETWPDLLPDFGAGMSLTVNNGHPYWDDWNTPVEPDAVAAFANFAAEAVQRFPAIHSVEVGNEMNSATFVAGPGWDTDLATRAVSYTALLAETAQAVKAARPEVRILGGAAHSVSLTWLGALFEAGAGEHMDAVVVHPYGVEPEHLGAQLSLMRQLPGAETLPIEITEFGHTDPDIAPYYLLKSYCQMALSGVTRVIWYPLNPRGDGLVPLVEKSGAITPVGKTYLMLEELAQDGDITPFRPDPFTYGCQFGKRHLILWGEPRDMALAAGVQVRSADARTMAPGKARMTAEHPVVLSHADDVLDAISLGPQRIIADSVHQFAFDGVGDPFDRLVASARDTAPFEIRPGQEKNGAPWSPYLGSGWDGVLRAGPDWVLPSAPSAGPLGVLYRYVPPQRMNAEVTVDIAPSERSEDGVDLTITAGGVEVFADRITGPTQIGPLPVKLRKRRPLEVRVGPGETSRGDFTRLKVTLRQPNESDS
ncbi:MAG: hypothetical protein AB3N23_06525 [Paracoccaceae bacterium]